MASPFRVGSKVTFPSGRGGKGLANAEIVSIDKEKGKALVRVTSSGREINKALDALTLASKATAPAAPKKAKKVKGADESE